MDLSLLSRHRTSLMGVAAMLIVFCHASGFVPDASPVLKKLMEFGNLGVDIFLLLSGIGLFYSLTSRTKNIFAWYGHRYLRILVPYLLIAVPYWLYASLANGESIGRFLFNISTLSFWTDHVGAWYVAMLIPLYLITPLLHESISNRLHYIVAFFEIALILAICSIPSVEGSIFENVQFVMIRIPAFIVGLAIGPAVKAGRKVNLFLVFGALIVLFGIFKYVWMPGFTITPKGLALSVILALILECLSGWKIVKRVLDLFGRMSLEIYLCNIFICSVFINSDLRYWPIVLLTIFTAWAFHYLSTLIYRA